MKELDSTLLPLCGSHLIEASAGTGKTHNIVRLYLRLLLEKDYRVDQILVMTFTNAATAELRHRLSRFLRETIDGWSTSEDPIIQSLREHIDAQRATLLLQRALLQLDEATIYTIHSFCKRALSQQAFLSGMSFNANMEADSALLKQQAVEDWYRQQTNTPEFSVLYESGLSTPEDFLKKWSALIDNNDPLVSPNSLDTTAMLARLQQQWSDEQLQFKSLNKKTARSNAETLAAQQSTHDKLSALANGNATLDHIQFTQIERDKSFSTDKKKANMPAAYELVCAVIHNQNVDRVRVVLDGIAFMQAHIRRNKGRLDQLDFNDLIVQLKLALYGPNQDELRAALRQQFPAALVDEFQDTDPEQYQILEAIYRDQPHSFLCMIGDPKQAIYGFRGGDVFAYLKARDNVDHQWTMNTNYRSSPALIAGYNRLFLQQETAVNAQTFGFGIEYRQVLASEHASNPSFSDDHERHSMQWVQFEPENTPSKGLTKPFLSTMAQWCVGETLRLIQRVHCNNRLVQPGDIAFLVRGYYEADLLKNALSSAGIPSVYLSARANVFQTEEAKQLHQFLSGVWRFENDRAFIAALASDWIHLSLAELDQLQQDEHHWAAWQEKFEHWRNEWQHRGLMSMLLNVLKQDFTAPSDHADRQITNMLHLAEILQKESTQHRQPDTLLQWFERIMKEDNAAEEYTLRLESDEALVKIITMHGAKGLEYPIVFLPFASYSGGKKQTGATVRYHDRTTLNAQRALLPSEQEKQWSSEEEHAESIRLFYVAITRAAQRTYCCVAPFTHFNQSPIGLTLKQETFDVDALSQLLTVDQSASLLTVHENTIPLNTALPSSPPSDVSPAVFHGHIERDWWLSSFSSLTRHVGHSGKTTPDRDETEPADQPSNTLPLRFRLAKGAEAGNLLHDILEHADFSQPNTQALYEKTKARYPSLADSFTEAELEQWLNELRHAPLTQGGTLGQLSVEHTLRECEFYFPMAGRDMSTLANLVSARRGSPYQLPDHAKLKGMMHGFIDLIFEMDGQYYVADYKSNYLGEQLSDYSIDAMTNSIQSSSYDLQYLIYSLALHRYLTVRLPNYQPEQHFGGVYYFYLRGMAQGSKTGVFFDPLSPQLLTQLDALFANEPMESLQ